jgi:hypothetical protein
MPKKLHPIDYTSRDFDSIRRDLENFAKRYYADTYRDFNEASFGSLMLDTVSYVGDILSFYLDYQANESFLETAVEYNNVVKLARQLGYKIDRNPSSYGLLTFYIKVPAATTGPGPNLSLAPTLRAGSTFSSSGGGLYTTLDDVVFAASTNQVVVGTVDTTTGLPTSYVIRAQARAVSGQTAFQRVELGSFERFRKVRLDNANISSVLSVADSEGHIYYEVDHLSQNIIFKAIRNTTSTQGTVPNILKAVPVPRRFVVESNGRDTFLQFGYGSDSELQSEAVVDPSNLMLNLHGRDYITDPGFDPTKLISSDKFGIAPANTTLQIGYRLNTTQDVNAGANTIVNVANPRIKFASQGTLSAAARSAVIQSLEVSNEAPFVGSVSLPTADDIKQRVFGYFATQNRAVTTEDYRAMSYAMPAKFGAVRSVNIVRDFDEFKRNLNLYVISEDTSGKLSSANQTLKNNLKNWIVNYKMINDTVDILDAKIINFGIKYTITTDLNSNRYTILNEANRNIRNYYFANRFEIGEPITLNDIFRQLNKVPGIVDVISVQIVNKNGGLYSESDFDPIRAMSSDGRSIRATEASIFELKFPNVDIEGSIK